MADTELSEFTKRETSADSADLGFQAEQLSHRARREDLPLTPASSSAAEKVIADRNSAFSAGSIIEGNLGKFEHCLNRFAEAAPPVVPDELRAKKVVPTKMQTV